MAKKNYNLFGLTLFNNLELQKKWNCEIKY